ncbi:ParB/RepB/Spo0J family partition protein [Leeia sp. TBRC 13508]|uniref:ParB/RepB/Spo0J family partition protein n=1 Tax=Leeia speluncae TaxID=2884804 RepID=A0ABS8DBW6_9NEIS|nr:ParB/RepB/Spo0J family partition protein [Leeia speluncae]MCB6185133.1 ParB/RepB/Spo0J family partition protein [Leeia speluncae]
MARDLSKLLEAKLQENTNRHIGAHQETYFDAGKEYTKLPVNLIDKNPYQPRIIFPQEEIESLANSIKELGLMQPISVRRVGDRYELIAGERRLLAHKHLGKNTIEALIVPASDAEMAMQALAENIDRSDLTDFEIGIALRAIESSFENKTRLAEAVGINREDMYKYFAFDDLPDFIKEELKEYPGLLSRAAAAKIKSLLEKTEEHIINPILKEGWKKLIKNEIDQTKLSVWIAQQIETTKSDDSSAKQMLLRDFTRQGRKVGSYQATPHGITIKLKSKYLTEDQKEALQLYISDLLEPSQSV